MACSFLEDVSLKRSKEPKFWTTFLQPFYSGEVLKERTYKENYAEPFLCEPRNGVKKLKVRSEPMASRRRFQNDRALKRENRTKTLLCDVIVVSNIAAFLHQ